MSVWKTAPKAKPTGKAKPVKYTAANIASSKRRGSKISDKPYLDMSMLEPPKMITNSSYGTTKFEHDQTESPMISMGMYIPLYDNRKRKQDLLKDQLADVTGRLHKDGVVKNTRNKLKNMQQGEMKETIEALLGQYDQEVTENTIGAINERDELLYQLADWFSADHSELEELDVSMNKEEETELDKSFNATIITFEKMKRVQRHLKMGNLDPKKLLAFEKEKKKLEMDMVSNVKVMQHVSVQASPGGGDTDPVPWKNAADQIVSMLNQVRLEGNEELMHLGEHLKELMKNLEKQQKQVKSLQADVKREKKVTAQLSDENTELNMNLRELQEKVLRLKNDLDKANKALKKQSTQEKSKKAAVLAPPTLMVKKSAVMVQGVKEVVKPASTKADKSNSTDKGRKLKLTLSGVIGEFLDGDVPVHETSSDATLLRSCIRDQREALKILSQEVKRLQNQEINLEDSLKEQTSQVVTLKDENEVLTDKIADIELELEKYACRSLEPIQVKCPRCKQSENSPVTPAVSVGSNKEDEIKKLKDRLTYFQKCLADTELKLSEAYKEISELRLQLAYEPQKKPSVPPPTPTDKVKEEEEETEEESEPEEEVQEVVEVEIVKHRGFKQRRPIKRPPHKKKVFKLPPLPNGNIITTLQMEEDLPYELDMPEATSVREEKLWKLGDLQGRMSQLMQEILEFIKHVADMIFIDQNGTPVDARFTAMQPFAFDKKDVKRTKTDDIKSVEGRQKRSQAFFLGQKAIGCLKDAYDLLSGSLTLQHEDYELIYRAFKNYQYQRSIRQAVMAGKLPLSALHMAKNGQIPDLKATYAALQQSLKSQKPHTSLTEGGVWKAASTTSLASDLSEGHKAALNNAVMVLGIHRSKSEVDVHSVQSDVSHTSSHYMPRENSQILLSANNSEILRERRTAGLNREETRIPTTKLPKKGLIKLTSLDYEMQDPTYYDKYKDDLDEDSWIRKKPLGHISEPHKPLVKKTMIEHMKEGKRMLEEQEKLHHEQEEIEKQLGEYTIADLHKNLEDVTTELVKKKSEEIVKSVAKPFNKHVTQRKQRQQPVERSVTLPSIKDFSFG
ncbi:myosin-9-like isoform X3 [Mytilus edulis]|uniref:myosin-9-like isoform X3 n=1 Tax=Mytilus edulis TaxID=6550 RepID=UPI0039EEEC11